MLSLNAYDNFGKSTLHAYQRTHDHMILCWAAENKQSEYYHRGEKGEKQLNTESVPVELSNRNSMLARDFLTAAKQSHGVEKQVMYGRTEAERD